MTEKTTCQVKKCSHPVRAKRYCDRHYRSWRRGELAKSRYKICKSEACRKPMIREGYCQAHFDTWYAGRKNVARLAKKTEIAATPPPAPAATVAEPPPSPSAS